jgi:hypothetical protein
MFEILRMKRKKENVIELPGVNKFQEQINCVTSFLKSAGINPNDFELSDVLVFVKEGTLKINMKTKGAKL